MPAVAFNDSIKTVRNPINAYYLRENLSLYSLGLKLVLSLNNLRKVLAFS
jgi:hypothetical protein